MPVDRNFEFKKFQIENFLKEEFEKTFRGSARISIRKRQKFMQRVTKKVGKRFGKDVLCLVDFTKQGFTTLVSPSRHESTEKGRLYHSYLHPQVAYTTHCIDRFSERTETAENVIIILDGYLNDALLTFGLHDGFLVCRAGVLAYVLEEERLVIKTFIASSMLSEEQIREFYGWDAVSSLTPEMITDNTETLIAVLQGTMVPVTVGAG